MWLSDAAYDLVRDVLFHLELGAELRYLGEHRLKDLKHTERISQVLVPGLLRDFPPLETHGLVTSTELSNLDRRYRCLRHLGGGGFGYVYLVHHETLNRRDALKVLKSQNAEDEQCLERFKRETKSAAKPFHPNIVAIYNAGEDLFGDQRVSYVAMGYISGGTLTALIRQQRGSLP